VLFFGAIAMKLEAADLKELAPAIDSIVEQVVAKIEQRRLQTERIGYPEREAAALIGLKHHVLRDARRRGQIGARKIGRNWMYSREALLKFLESNGEGAEDGGT
jgi:hypothetical protein